MKILQSKKVIVSLVGLIAAVVSTFGLDLSPAMQTVIITAIAAIVGSFNVGQGLADGLSGGITSGSVQAIDEKVQADDE